MRTIDGRWKLAIYRKERLRARIDQLSRSTVKALQARAESVSNTNGEAMCQIDGYLDILSAMLIVVGGHCDVCSAEHTQAQRSGFGSTVTTELGVYQRVGEEPTL